MREIVATLHVSPERVRTLYHHWIIDLETGERLRPPKAPEPRNAHSRRRAPASAALLGQSSSLPRKTDVRRVASSDDRPTDLAASSNAVTALFEKLLGNHRNELARIFALVASHGRRQQLASWVRDLRSQRG